MQNYITKVTFSIIPSEISTNSKYYCKMKDSEKSITNQWKFDFKILNYKKLSSLQQILDWPL